MFTDTASLSEAPPSEIFICAIRPNAEGQLFQLKTTSTKGAYLTDIARANLVFDYNYLKDLEKDNIIRNKIAVIAELKAKGKKQRQPVLEKATMPRGRPKSFTTKIAEWYQVTSDAVRRITAKASARASTAQAPRSGRPRIVTPRKEAALLDTFNQEQGPPMRRLTALTEEALKDRGIDYETSYGSSEKRRSMSKTTVTNVVKKKFDLHDLKIKPINDARNQARRVGYLQGRVDDGYKSYDVDEMYLRSTFRPRYATLKGKAVPPGVETFREDAAHGHPPQLLLACLVGPPKILNEETCAVEGARFDPHRNGKVMLMRLRGRQRRKRSRRGEDGNIIPKENDPIFTNITINGDVYAKMWTGEGGFQEALADYMAPPLPGVTRESARVFVVDEDEIETDYSRYQVGPRRQPDEYVMATVQEDNAGGHGMSSKNKAGLTSSAPHNYIHDYLARRNVHLIQQPPNTPDVNMCDLGVWNMLKSMVGQNQSKIPMYNGKNSSQVEAVLWELVKQAWNEIEPRKLYSIAMQKQENIRLIVESGGATIGRDVHTGIRKKHGLGTPKRPRTAEE